MKKTYSKAELEKKAKDVFKEYPSAKSLFATTDGQFFLDKNRANLHAGAKEMSLKLKMSLKLIQNQIAKIQIQSSQNRQIL